MSWEYMDFQDFLRDPRWKSIHWSYLNIESLDKKVKGLYVFICREKQRCIYVGKAVDQSIKARLSNHWSRSHNKSLRLWIKSFGDFLYVRYCPIPDTDTEQGRHLVDSLENQLIKASKPKVNIQLKRK